MSQTREDGAEHRSPQLTARKSGPQQIAIVGGGLAAARTAEMLRYNQFDGRILLFGQEPVLPYHRPPLSKSFLAGQLALGDFTISTEQWYRDQRVEVSLGVRVTGVDSTGHSLTLADGSSFGYDKLLLATGSRSTALAIPGADAEAVHYLRTYHDAAALDVTLSRASSLAVIGAGWIGLEVAAVARHRGVTVTVIDPAPLPLPRLGPVIGQTIAELHRAQGVRLLTQVSPSRIVTDKGVACGLELTDGTTIGADAVLIAAGVRANSELAEQAGLAIGGGGVITDASLRSSHPDIYAAGDVAAALHPRYGIPIRFDHHATALQQPNIVAASMLGRNVVYDSLPYFYTEQYDFRLDYLGYAPHSERVTFRGDTSERTFSAFWLGHDDTVLAGTILNAGDSVDDLSKIISSGTPVNTRKLADPDVALPGVLA